MPHFFNMSLDEEERTLLDIKEGVKMTYRELEIIACLLNGRS